jgi:hypothetical protein
MHEELNNCLNNTNYINDYIISNINDLYNKDKINFNCILLKYFIKNSIYEYDNKLLKKAKNVIRNIIKKGIEEQNIKLFFGLNRDLRKKIEYIILFIMDSKYYLYEFFKRNEPQISLFILNKEKEKITEEENEYFKNINQPSTKDLDNNNQKNEKNKRRYELKYFKSLNKNQKEKESLNYYIKQLSNKLFVSGGGKYLFFYDASYNLIEEIEIDNNNIYEKINCKNDSYIEIYVCSNNKISIIYINC